MATGTARPAASPAAAPTLTPAEFGHKWQGVTTTERASARFAWEYKGKRKDLKAAYRQLNDYREDLDNPPLLVVSDLDRFEVHTNFTGTPHRVHAFTLADIAHDPTEPLTILRAVFRDPDALRPDMTPEEVTEEAAKLFGTLARTSSRASRSTSTRPSSPASRSGSARSSGSSCM